MRRLFEGGVYFEITFLNSLTTVTVKGLEIFCNLKVPLSLLICCDRIVYVWIV